MSPLVIIACAGRPVASLRWWGPRSWARRVLGVGRGRSGVGATSLAASPHRASAPCLVAAGNKEPGAARRWAAGAPGGCLA